MVTMSAPSVALSGSEQDRTGSPLTCTVQAPQAPMPQPNLVPVSPRSSRRTHSRGLSGSASTARGWPFTFRLVIAPPPPVPSTLS